MVPRGYERNYKKELIEALKRVALVVGVELYFFWLIAITV